MLGIPVSVLTTVLTKAEYFKWLSYIQYKQPDSLEMQIAVLTAMTHAAAGGKDSTYEDFLIHKRDLSTTQPKEMNPVDVGAFFGNLAT